MSFDAWVRSVITGLVWAGLIGWVPTTAVAAETVMEEIVVTAQKREQSPQDVPFSVTAVTGETLARYRVHDVQDLVVITPGLFITSTGSPGQGTAFRLRGFGSPNFQ